MQTKWLANLRLTYDYDGLSYGNYSAAKWLIWLTHRRLGLGLYGSGPVRYGGSEVGYEATVVGGRGGRRAVELARAKMVGGRHGDAGVEAGQRNGIRYEA